LRTTDCTMSEMQDDRSEQAESGGGVGGGGTNHAGPDALGRSGFGGGSERPSPGERPFTPWPEQDEDGVDLSLIRANLKLSPTERLRRGERALKSALWLRGVARRHWEPSSVRGGVAIADRECDFEKIFAICQQEGVELIVIGGQAALFYGWEYVTYDLDLCYRRTSDNLERLAKALRRMNPTLRNAPPDLPFILDAKSLALGDSFTFSTDYGPLDMLGHVESIGGYDELEERAENVEEGDVRLKFIALDDLIRSKRHINRPKDRESLEQLEAIRRLREEREPD